MKKAQQAGLDYLTNTLGHKKTLGLLAMVNDRLKEAKVQKTDRAKIILGVLNAVGHPNALGEDK